MRQRTMKALGTQPFFLSQHKLNKSTAQTNSLLLLALVQNEIPKALDPPSQATKAFKPSSCFSPLSHIPFCPTKRPPIQLVFHGYL